MALCDCPRLPRCSSKTSTAPPQSGQSSSRYSLLGQERTSRAFSVGRDLGLKREDIPKPLRIMSRRPLGKADCPQSAISQTSGTQAVALTRLTRAIGAASRSWPVRARMRLETPDTSSSSRHFQKCSAGPQQDAEQQRQFSDSSRSPERGQGHLSLTFRGRHATRNS